MELIGKISEGDRVEGMEGVVRACLHDGFTRVEHLQQYRLGSKSNVGKVRKALLEKDLICEAEKGIFVSDPVMAIWIRHNIH